MRSIYIDVAELNSHTSVVETGTLLGAVHQLQ